MSSCPNPIQDKFVQKKYFILIHEYIYERLDHVSPQAERLYRILRSYSDAEYKPCFPKIKTLASRMGVSSDSVHRYMRELQHEKLISIQKIGHNRNKYYFIHPEPSQSKSMNPPTTSSATEPAHLSQQTTQICHIHNNQNQSELNQNKNHTPLPNTTNTPFPNYLESHNQSPSHPSPNQSPNEKNSDDPSSSSSSGGGGGDDDFIKTTSQTDCTHKKSLTPNDTQTHSRHLEKKQTPILENFQNMLPSLKKLQIEPIPVQISNALLSKLEKHYSKELIHFVCCYTAWAHSNLNIKIMNPPGYITWLLKNYSSYDFSKFIQTLQKRMQKKQKQATASQTLKNKNQENHTNQESNLAFKKELEQIETFKQKNPEEFKKIKTAIEEEQKHARLFNKPETKAFTHMVHKKLITKIKEKNTYPL